MTLLKLIRESYRKNINEDINSDNILSLLRSGRCNTDTANASSVMDFAYSVCDYLPRFIPNLRKRNKDSHPYLTTTNDDDKAYSTFVRSHCEIDVCYDCDYFVYSHDILSAYHGDRLICENCCDDNYRFSEYQDTYVHYDDFDDEEEDYHESYEENGIYNYETDVLEYLDKQFLPQERKQLLKSNSRITTYGVELEVERRKNCDAYIGEHVNELLNGFAICKSDGSLDNGFEIVTAPCSYAYHKKRWEDFFKNDKCMQQLKGWNTDTAGLHIHIGRATLTPTDIGKILVFINDETNNEFINAIAGRDSSQWAKKSPKKITDSLHSSEKYEAVNLSHSETIELRIFRSNISRYGFYRILEFVDALVHFVGESSLATTSLHYKAFYHFMKKPMCKSRYPNLTAWLIRKGFIDGKPSRKISSLDESDTNTATN